MKFSKTRVLFAIVVTIIFLSVLAMAQTGGFWHEQTSQKEEKKDIPLTAEAYLQKGQTLYLEQQFEEACGSFNVAAIYAHMDEDWERKFQALKGMADCLFWAGAADSCLYHYQKAVALAKELGHTMEEYEIYDQMKQAYIMKVDMQSAMRMEQKIDSIESQNADKRIDVRKQLRLANEAKQQQNPQLEEHFLLKAEHLLDSLTTQDRLGEQILVLGTIRDFYWGLHDIENARKYSQLLINTVKSSLADTHLVIIPAYSAEALISAQQKDRKGAFTALDSIKHNLSLSNDASPRNQMKYYKLEGEIHETFEEWEEACKAYKKALLVVEDTYVMNGVDYFQIVNMLGGALFQCKKYDEARPCYEIIAEFCEYQYGKESLAYADALWTLANFNGYCGKTDTGKQNYIKSVDICKHLVTEQLRYTSVQERNAFWMSFAPKMWSMTAYAMKIGERQSTFTEKCYEALLFSKALLLESDRTLATIITTECTPEEQQVYYEMQSLQNQLKALMNDYKKNKERIEELHQKISTQNQRLTPIISKLKYTSFLKQNYNDIRQSLKKDEVLLDFTDYKSDEEVQQFAAFVVNGEQSHPKLVKSFTEEEIKILLAGKPADFLYKEPYASKAFKLIWEPLAKEAKGKKTIYYVPSGILHRIALESLPLSDGSLLGEHYDFIRLSSAREIANLNKGTKTTQQTTATLYGALKYDMDADEMSQQASRYKIDPLLVTNRGVAVKGDEPFNELLNAKEEIDKIEEILTKKHVKVKSQTGTTGTEESFLALSGKAPNFLHIATHGFYYTPEKAKDITYLNGYHDAMFLSGLIMAGGNRVWTGQEIPKGALGGVLTANSIASMDLRGVELVVLSACKTGLGVATPEGLFGLQRAFKKAGVQTIIMSLWNVDDEAAKDFMVKFYEELAYSQNRWDKRRAFEKAKAFIRSKTYVRKGKAYTGDPYYWAAFVMLD